jgi:hypothetical protein
MKWKLIFLLFFILISDILFSQKLLRSTYSECRNQFETDPNVYKVTSDYGKSNLYLYVTLKDGNKYKLTFTNFSGDKLYGMQLTCNTIEKTKERFNMEITKHNAFKQNNSYCYYDEKGRKIYIELRADDFGNVTIVWEAAFPFQFD